MDSNPVPTYFSARDQTETGQRMTITLKIIGIVEHKTVRGQPIFLAAGKHPRHPTEALP